MEKAGLSPYLKFNEYSGYHTSAVIAAAIDTNTLPYRLKHNPIAMADTVSRLNMARSTSLASLSVTVPLPILQNGYIPTVETFKNTAQLRPTLELLDRVSKSSLTKVKKKKNNMNMCVPRLQLIMECVILESGRLQRNYCGKRIAI